jgi:hypothetical protein
VAVMGVAGIEGTVVTGLAAGRDVCGLIKSTAFVLLFS